MIDNREKNFVSAVIYVHDVEHTITEFVKTIAKTLSENFEHSEIICVNDASSDESAKKIREATKENDASQTSVTILNLSFFHGLEASMDAGKELAIGDFVFEFDLACLDFDPSLVLTVYKRALDGFDIVSAVPDTSERFSSHLFYSILNRYGHFPYRFCTERFRVISRRAINRVSAFNREIVYRKTVYASCGLKSANLQYHPVSSASVTLGRRERIYRRELAFNSILLFTELGYRFSRFVTILMGFASFAMLIYSIVIYCTGTPVRGWTSSIFLISAVSFGLFVILTFVIKYLQILVNLSFKRGNFTFESIEKISG